MWKVIVAIFSSVLLTLVILFFIGKYVTPRSEIQTLSTKISSNAIDDMSKEEATELYTYIVATETVYDYSYGRTVLDDQSRAKERKLFTSCVMTTWWKLGGVTVQEAIIIVEKMGVYSQTCLETNVKGMLDFKTSYEKKYLNF